MSAPHTEWPTPATLLADVPDSIAQPRRGGPLDKAIVDILETGVPMHPRAEIAVLYTAAAAIERELVRRAAQRHSPPKEESLRVRDDLYEARRSVAVFAALLVLTAYLGDGSWRRRAGADGLSAPDIENVAVTFDVPAIDVRRMVSSVLRRWKYHPGSEALVAAAHYWLAMTNNLWTTIDDPAKSHWLDVATLA